MGIDHISAGSHIGFSDVSNSSIYTCGYDGDTICQYGQGKPSCLPIESNEANHVYRKAIDTLPSITFTVTTTGYAFQYPTEFGTTVMMDSKTTGDTISSVETVTKKLYLRQRADNSLFKLHMNEKFLLQIVRNTVTNSFGSSKTSY